MNPNWVITDTFFAVDDDRIVGIIDFRHTLNDFLKDLGHCGYSVRPSERRKGFATEMLRQLLEVAQKIGMNELYLSVEKKNEPSVKTIIRNGGVYERSFEIDGEQADIYRIALSKLSAFLTIVLFTVGILNFINTMSVSILGRQREFATMEAVGASKKQMQKFIAWEGVWYFLLTLALSVTLGSGADFLIFHVVRENVGFGTFRYPAVPMTLYMLLSMLLCMIIPAVVYKRAGIRSIVERLRDN